VLLKAKHANFETVVARLEALELRKNHSIQITAEKSLCDQMVEVKNQSDFVLGTPALKRFKVMGIRSAVMARASAWPLAIKASFWITGL